MQINELGYSISPKPKGKFINLLIDNEPLLDILDKAHFELYNNEEWSEKKDAMVVTKELKKSSKNSGEYPILTSIQCKMIEDLSLTNFQVIHEGKYIIWKVNPPGADYYIENYEALVFKFNKLEYIKVIDCLIEEKVLA